MNDKKIRDVVIVGGGTAGWMAAASLSKFLSGKNITITLIESSSIGTVGVGEATLPSLREFNQYLGIDELDFIKTTQATFKLGIKFNDWHKLDTTFFHPFGNYGTSIKGVDFHHYWHKAKLHGATEPLSEYCLASLLARENKFSQPNFDLGNPLAIYNYAFHFNATDYAKLLRSYAEKRSVKRIDSQINEVTIDKINGGIQSINLSNGQTITGDFFIDCSGFKGLLIEGALKTNYQDWSHWLPCDSAVAIPCKATSAPNSYTESTAMEAGWRWKIPLQSRVGNGSIFCSQYFDKQKAADNLLATLEGAPLAEVNHLRFTTGKRQKTWVNNCVALGLAAGFLEPLESTSISFIQSGISLIHQYFPFNGFNTAEINEANRHTQLEFERARDFLILHYKTTTRTDSEFWNYCRNMSIPDSLLHKIELYKARGHLLKYEVESFEDASWLSLYAGMNILPNAYDTRVDDLPLSVVTQQLGKMHSALTQGCKYSPKHADFIKKHCAI